MRKVRGAGGGLSPFPRLKYVNHIRNFPKAICDSSGHRGRRLQPLMDMNKIVIEGDAGTDGEWIADVHWLNRRALVRVVIVVFIVSSSGYGPSDSLCGSDLPRNQK